MGNWLRKQFYTHEALIAIEKSDYTSLKKIITRNSFDINGRYKYYCPRNRYVFIYNLLEFAYYKQSSVECINLLFSHGCRYRFCCYQCRVNECRKYYNFKNIRDQKDFLIWFYLEEDPVTFKEFKKIETVVNILYCFQKRNINLFILY